MKPLQVIGRPDRMAQTESVTILAPDCPSGVRTDSRTSSQEPLAAGIASHGATGPRADSRSASQEPVAATRRAILAARDLPALQAAIISHLRRTCRPVFAAWYYATGAQIGQTDRLEGLMCPSSGMSSAIRQQLKDAAVAAIRSDELQSVRFPAASSLRLIALPIPGVSGQCLLAVIEDNTDSAELSSPAIAEFQLLGSLITERSILSAMARATDSARATAALIELMERMQSAGDSSAACQRLADALRQHLVADEVIVGLSRNGTAECRITAVSGGQVIERLSERTRLIESVLQESIVRSAGAVWPVQDAANRHALLSHQQLSESEHGSVLVSMPLQTESGSAAGSLLAIFSPAAFDSENDSVDRVRDAERFLRAGATPLASCLSILQKLADSRWLQWAQTVRNLLTASRLQLAAWLAGALAVVLLLPVMYSVNATSELQPVERRYVAAPFAGPLEECLVEPGDVVQKDQLLARMDGREIRWELAEVQASLNKAIKERNTQVSSREFGSAAITGHEIQRLEQRSELLTFRDASLEIRSPADGVVVSGDHREAEGVPLETGQTLFEIALLDAMVVEICIPEDDVRHVVEGMNVTIQLDAVPDDTLDATIRCVHPRAELRDGRNVFVAEADILNADGILRPGMRGHARVLTERHTLGWNLFHKPVAYLLCWLGW